MKQAIHPQWYSQAKVSCVCGNAFSVGSTKEEIRVEICSNCHPFFTGKQTFGLSIGKVERFKQKQEKAKEMAPILAVRKAKKANIPLDDSGPKSLKEMLMGV